MSTSGTPPNAPHPNAAAGSNAGAKAGQPVDNSARARAQRIIDHAHKNKKPTLDDLQELVELVEEATHAEPQIIARFFNQAAPSGVGWGDCPGMLGFSNTTNLTHWENVESHGIWISIAHAFAAVSMEYVPYDVNAFINHVADVADLVPKGLAPVFSEHRFPTGVLARSNPAVALGVYLGTAKWEKFSSEIGYGRANRLGDWFGDYLALYLISGYTLAEAFRATRKRMNL
jgi:hypothetical protein